MGVTDRLYYSNSYLTQFSATILDVQDQGRRIYLDQTAFYPTSGGQLFDQGKLNQLSVTDVIDEDGRIAHILANPDDTLRPGMMIQGEIDWNRRFDHMQQHSGQHLLSAIFAEKLQLETISVHLGEAVSTIDLETASIDPQLLSTAETLANQVVFQNLPIAVQSEDADTVEGLRKASARQGLLRIVTIQGLDKSACGGTHVRATGEIGPILIRRTEKVRNATRVEFVCGQRALEAIRAEASALKEQAAQYQNRLSESEKEKKKLLTEVAAFRGLEKYQHTESDAQGRRIFMEQVPEITDAIRLEAQSFTQQSQAVYAVLAGNSVLLATSRDSGLHAGNIMKEIADKGGGSATMAQGSASNTENTLNQIRNKILSAV